LPLNAWTHLAATYDGSSLRLYINGAAPATMALPGSIATSAGPLRIGGNSVWGEYFSGLIDNLRIYDRALSGAELGAEAAALPSDVGAALAVPSTVLGDLPSQVLGKPVTWTATGAGVARLAAAATSNRTAAGVGTAALSTRRATRARVSSVSGASSLLLAAARPSTRREQQHDDPSQTL
jgi:hypothetical protein